MSPQTGIGRLPSDVLHQIMCLLTADYSANTMHAWKGELKLLAVCRQWRAVGAPLVYKSVFLKDSVSVIHDHDDFGHATGCQILPYWQQNLDLIIDGGYQHCVRRLVVNQNKAADYLESLQSLQDVVGQNIIDWSRINGLYIDLTGARSQRGSDAGDGDLQRVAMYAQQFVRSLPNVRRMVGHMKSKANVNKAFISQLYTHYAPQLHAFQAEYLHHPVNMRFGHELVSLETTGMCFKRLGERAIYAPALKRLAIRQAIYHRLPWAAFYDDGGSSGKTLAFQSLTCLQLEYNCGDSQVDRALNSTIPVFPKQLLFPKLQKLEVTGFLLSCPVMFNAQLPPQLRKMRLMCPVRVARVLASRTLPTAFDISCGIITDLIDNDPDPMKAANALLGALRATERLFVDYSVLGANCWADMEWSSITSLKIRSRVSASDILLLVSRVPRVQSLNLWGVHVSEPELEDIVEKFSSKYPDANFHDVALRTLHLHRAADGVCIYSCFRFVEILRRTIPGLRTITLDGTSRA